MFVLYCVYCVNVCMYVCVYLCVRVCLCVYVYACLYALHIGLTQHGCMYVTGLDKWLPIRPAHKDDEISGEVLVALRLEKIFTATDPTTEKVISSLYYAFHNTCNITKSQQLHDNSLFISLIMIRS